MPDGTSNANLRFLRNIQHLMDHVDHLRAILQADPARMRILRQVSKLGLHDFWVAAGFVRSAIWDRQHQRMHSPLPPDIDVIWFDANSASADIDAAVETDLSRLDSAVNWSVKNQARMHLRNDDPPYYSVEDAIRAWPETATAVAVRLTDEDVIAVAAPHGLNDLFNLVVRPTEGFRVQKRQIYLDRIRSKNWLGVWPGLTFVDS